MIPTTGQRNTQKFFAALDLFGQDFLYHQDEVFNGETYVGFLNRIARSFPRKKVNLIHDNAAYHRSPEVRAWLTEHGRRIHLYALPPYSPEFNAVEPLWHHVRLNFTHNRYFETKEELCDTLNFAFKDIQKHPEQIEGYLQPFLRS